MERLFKHSLATLVILPILLLHGCSRNETSIKIVDVFRQHASSNIQILYTKTIESVSCPLGAHGCTYNTLEQDLYQITLPLEPASLGEAALISDSQWIRSGTNQNDYSYFVSNQAMVLGNTRSEVLEMCVLAADSSDSCSSITQLHRNESDRSQIVLSDTGRTFFWNDALYSIANLDPDTLKEKPGYLRFLEGIATMQANDSTNTSVRIHLFDDQTLLAKATFASAADAPLGLIYSLPLDEISWVGKAFENGEASVSVLAAQQFQNELFFLLNFFDFEDGTANKLLDSYYFYNTVDESLIPIENPNFREAEQIWDVANQKLYRVSVSGRNSILISETEVF